MKNRIPLHRTNPLKHHVYTGWMWFFNRYFDFISYTVDDQISYPFQLQEKRLYKKHNIPLTSGTSFLVADKKKTRIPSKDWKIVGDIMAGTLGLQWR
jgi:hypothetical protein